MAYLDLRTCGIHNTGHGQGPRREVENNAITVPSHLTAGHVTLLFAAGKQQSRHATGNHIIYYLFHRSSVFGGGYIRLFYHNNLGNATAGPFQITGQTVDE